MSVRSSVTSRYCFKTAIYVGSKKQRHTIVDSSFITQKKDLYKIPMESPSTGAQKAGGVGKNSVFLAVREVSRSDALCRKLLSIRHGGPSPRRCANGVMVVVEICWSQCRSSWHQRGWLCGILLMTARLTSTLYTCVWHVASPARCAIVEPIVLYTLPYTANYAGSRTKRGSCWNCSSGWHGALCASFAQQWQWGNI